MTPLDDPAIPGLSGVAKTRALVTGIPSQAVEALREAFRRALRDADREGNPHTPPDARHEAPPGEGEEPSLDSAPPEIYDAHGELPPPQSLPEVPHVDLEG